MSRAHALPTCVPVRPVVLVAALRGAIGRRDGTAVEVNRVLRDHRDDLAPDVVDALLHVFAVTFASGVIGRADRDFWAPTLAELRRPPLTLHQRARLARAERINR